MSFWQLVIISCEYPFYTHFVLILEIFPTDIIGINSIEKSYFIWKRDLKRSNELFWLSRGWMAISKQQNLEIEDYWENHSCFRLKQPSAALAWSWCIYWETLFIGKLWQFWWSRSPSSLLFMATSYQNHPSFSHRWVFDPHNLKLSNLLKILTFGVF